MGSTMANGYDGSWLILGLLGFAVTVVEFRQRRTAGILVRDLGRNPGRPWVLLAAFLITGQFLTRVLRPQASIWFEAFGYAGLLCALATASTRRIQIREAGLLGRRFRVVRWDKIAGYELTPTGSLSLNLRNGRSIFYCDVPADSREDVGELLTVKYPSAPQGTK